MSFAASYAEKVEWSWIAKLCPKEAKALEAALKKYKVEEATLGECYRFTEPDTDCIRTAIYDGLGEEVTEGDTKFDHKVDQGEKEIIAAYESLRAAFKKATTVGRSCLELHIFTPVDEEDGSEVDGVFWHITGAYQLSPAGDFFKDKFERVYWTTYVG